jgi:hypothetical protein
MKNFIALEGKHLPEWSADEKAVYEVLKQQAGRSLSVLGLSRWIRNNPDLMKADKKIAAAAKNLASGMVIAEDVDGNYCCI